MGWREFAANVIGSVAWPLTVLGVVLTMWFASPKADRAALLRRLRKAGPSGVELDQAAAEVATAVQPIREAVTAHGTLAATPMTDAQVQRQISRLIDAAARWGWIRAGGNPDEFIHPIVAWSEGDAVIVGAKFHLNPGDSVMLAPGSFVNPRTGRANKQAYVISNWQPGDDIEAPPSRREDGEEARPGESN